MKKTWFYLTAFIICSTSLFAQEQTSSNTLRTSKSESTYKFDYKTEYLLEEAELKACFKNGIITTDLPKMSVHKTEDAYKVAIGYYINANPHLFVAEEVKKYGYTLIEKPTPTGDEYGIYKRKEPLSDEEIRIEKEKHPKQ